MQDPFPSIVFVIIVIQNGVVSIDSKRGFGSFSMVAQTITFCPSIEGEIV